MLALSISINKKQPNQRSLSQALRWQTVDPHPYCGAFTAVIFDHRWQCESISDSYMLKDIKIYGSLSK